MQEEVENRSVNLAVSTTKLTARTLIRAFRWYLMHRNQKRLHEQMKHPFKEGKQSVDDLLKAGVSTDKIELPDGSAKDFCKVAKQFGVDYAIRKDKTSDPPRYIVFFKAKDTEVLDQVVKEYSCRIEDKKKQSVRAELKAEKEKARTEKRAEKTKKRKERTEGR